MTTTRDSSLSISMVLITYNHEDFILNALDSISRFSDAHPQVVIAEDCSDDETRNLIEAWIKRNTFLDITFITNSVNVGLVRTMNTALEAVSGDYIALLSGDDVFAPSQLLRQVHFLQMARPQVGAVYSDMQFIDHAGFPKGRWSWGLPFRIESRFHQAQLELLRYNYLPSAATVIKREVFDKLGGYDPKYFYEDYGFWLKLAGRYEVAYLPGIATNYRLSANSMSRSGKYRQKMREAEMLILEDQIGVSAKGDKIVARRVLELVLKAPDSEIKGAINTGNMVLEKIGRNVAFNRLASRKIFLQSWFRRILHYWLFYGARTLNGLRLLAIYVTRKLPWMLSEVTKRRQSQP